MAQDSVIRRAMPVRRAAGWARLGGRGHNSFAHFLLVTRRSERRGLNYQRANHCAGSVSKRHLPGVFLVGWNAFFSLIRNAQSCNSLRSRGVCR